MDKDFKREYVAELRAAAKEKIEDADDYKASAKEDLQAFAEGEYSGLLQAINVLEKVQRRRHRRKSSKA